MIGLVPAIAGAGDPGQSAYPSMRLAAMLFLPLALLTEGPPRDPKSNGFFHAKSVLDGYIEILSTRKDMLGAGDKQKFEEVERFVTVLSNLGGKRALELFKAAQDASDLHATATADPRVDPTAPSRSADMTRPTVSRAPAAYDPPSSVGLTPKVIQPSLPSSAPYSSLYGAESMGPATSHQNALKPGYFPVEYPQPSPSAGSGSSSPFKPVYPEVRRGGLAPSYKRAAGPSSSPYGSTYKPASHPPAPVALPPMYKKSQPAEASQPRQLNMFYGTFNPSSPAAFRLTPALHTDA